MLFWTHRREQAGRFSGQPRRFTHTSRNQLLPGRAEPCRTPRRRSTPRPRSPAESLQLRGRGAPKPPAEKRKRSPKNLRAWGGRWASARCPRGAPSGFSPEKAPRNPTAHVTAPRGAQLPPAAGVLRGGWKQLGAARVPLRLSRALRRIFLSLGTF